MRKLLFGSILIIVSFCFGIKVQASRINDLGAPDSILYQLNDLNKTYKTVYQYKVNGFTATTSQFDDNAFKWIPLKQNILQTTNGVETLIEKNFNAAADSFISFQKFETKTDSLGRCLLHAFYSWDSIASNWKGVNFKTEKSFDAKGNLTSFTNSEWDKIHHVWSVYATGNFSYNTAGNPDTVNYFVPNTSKELLPSSRIINSYLSNGKQELETVFTYNTTSGSFIPSFRYRYVYGDTINQTTQYLELSDSTHNQWNNFQKTEMLFDKQGNLSSYVVSDIDTLSQQWVERYRQNISATAKDNSLQAFISYAPNNNELASEKYNLNNLNGAVMLSDTLYEEGLLSAYNQSQFLIQNGTITSFSNKNSNNNTRLEWSIDETNKTLNVNQFTRLAASTTKTEEINRSVIFYFGSSKPAIETNLPQIKTGKLTFYPNPAHENVTIANATEQSCIYHILSIDGKPLKTGFANEQLNTIPLSNLPQGAYILQLSSGNTTISRILIKQ
ncbi:T9SS type A sorting domain-containing protein [Parabacteroides sp. FAFU027]|uniref:T9SS type A sorting domain-containing protein n=1 Tax=Parabacteroides sp. FAFU027 TaxID=2922715 RepID=UPI001FB0391E|nr:T9SS type A sorting domain-containing protein [Parabacteroides sp. FAFU027]